MLPVFLLWPHLPIASQCIQLLARPSEGQLAAVICLFIPWKVCRSLDPGDFFIRYTLQAKNRLG